MCLRWSFDRTGFQAGVEWLRQWKVRWAVIIEGRKIAVFTDRKEAIKQEKEYFIKEGLP